jgi:hypothetical protein
MPQNRAERLPYQIEGTALVAENITPAASARSPAIAVPAKNNRTCAGDRNYSRLAGSSACKRDPCIVSDEELRGRHQFAYHCLFVRWSAAEATANGFESKILNARMFPCGTNAFLDRRYEPPMSLLRTRMVARSGMPFSQYSSIFVADESRRTGLAAIQSQE